jgi:hypothetical protein
VWEKEREHVHEVAQQIAQNVQHAIVDRQDDSTGHRNVGEKAVEAGAMNGWSPVVAHLRELAQLCQ